MKSAWSHYYRGVISPKEYAGNIHHHGPFLRELLATPGPLLEVGLGTGTMNVFLREQGKRAVGLDKDQAILRQVHKLALWKKTRVTLICADAFRLPFKGQAFHTVYAQGLLEHFHDQDVRALLQEFLRVARRALLSVPSDQYPDRAHSFGDERFLSVEQWQRILQTTGYRFTVTPYSRFEILLRVCQPCTYLEESKLLGIRGEYEDREIEYRVAARLGRATGLLRPGARVLDVGCAEGDLLRYLIKSGISVQYVGVDLLRAHERTIIVDLQEGGLPFKDKAFDICFCLEVIEHIRMQAAADVIREMKRVARSVILISPNAEGGFKNPYDDCEALHRSPDGRQIAGHISPVHLRKLKEWGFQDIGYVNFSNTSFPLTTQDPSRSSNIWGAWVDPSRKSCGFLCYRIFRRLFPRVTFWWLASNPLSKILRTLQRVGLAFAGVIP